VQLVELLVEDLVDRAEVLLAVVVSDVEHRPLGALHEVARGRLVRDDARLDLVRGRQQAAQQRVLAHDLGVVADVARRRDGAREGVDRALSAGLLEAAGLAHALGDREDVDPVALLVELEHHGVDRAVLVAVEVLRAQALLDDQAVHRLVREEDRAEHGLLGLEVVRRRRRGGDVDGGHRRSSVGRPPATAGTSCR
jgi:hypothetical protein